MTTDILAELCELLKSVPDPDTVPEKLDMHPSLFRRIEKEDRHRSPSEPELFHPFLPIDFDVKMPPDIVRVTYVSGRKELIVIITEGGNRG